MFWAFWQATNSGTPASFERSRPTAPANESHDLSPYHDVDRIDLIVKTRKCIGKLNANLVPQMLARHGFRWHNAHVNPALTNLVREAIIKNNVMEPRLYDATRSKDTEERILRHLRRSNAHAFAQHHLRVAQLVQTLFEETRDELVNKVKESVFGIPGGAPILPASHPIRTALDGVSKGKSVFSLFCPVLRLASPSRAGSYCYLTLFEPTDCEARNVTTSLGEQTLPAQKAFGELLKGLLHYKKDSAAYSIDPAKHPALPLYVDEAQNPLLNDMFWLIFNSVGTWTNMGSYSVESTEQALVLLEAEFPATADSCAGAGLPPCPKVCRDFFFCACVRAGRLATAEAYGQMSKSFVAYIETLIVLSPYWKAADARVASIAKEQFAKRLKSLEKVPDKEFAAYMRRKAGEFYAAYGLGPRGAAADGASAAARAEAGDVEEQEELLFALD
jgi:hypothetical protein